MEKKTEEEREKETSLKGRLSDKGYFKNGGMKEKRKLLELATMEKSELTHTNGFRTSTISAWTELTIHSHAVEQY